MSDQIFDDDNKDPQATPELNTPNVNPNNVFADQLAGIKNDNGEPKYDTVEKAIEALQHSQQYIPQLKTQVTEQEGLINELREKLEASVKVQDIVNKQTPPKDDNDNTNHSSMGEQEVLDIVANVLKERSVETTQSVNQDKVKQALAEKFGANASEEVAKRAKELGMKPSEIGELSKNNPAAALALFGEKIGNTLLTTTSFHIPADKVEIEPVKRPEKSVLSGATSQEQAALMKEIRDEVYRKHGIQS